jgi:phosphoserine phosphatase RsbX
MSASWIIAHRTLPKDGERANGDAVLVRREGEQVLVAVIDGLGHGEPAALAAGRATSFLSSLTLGGELLECMQGLHESLRGTRGAAATLCFLRGHAIECCGVGNVEIRSFGSKLPILLSPGVLGARVQKFRMCQAELAVDSRLVLFSDGISHRAPLETMRHLNVEDLCETMIRQHRKPSDDATVVACDLRA